MNNIEFEKILEKINRKLHKQYSHFKGTYFFGSRIKNQNLIDSDFDIVLTFSNQVDWKTKKNIYEVISDFEVENDIIIDTHIYTLDEILNPITPFRFNVKQDGIFYAV